MKLYKKLIFVDADDTSRAPMAKVIMKTKPLFRPIEIDSRGLVVLFSQPINQKAEAVLISNGYSAKGHASTAFSSEDLQEGNLILTMEEAQRDKIREEYPDAEDIYTISEFLQMEKEVESGYIGELVMEELKKVDEVAYVRFASVYRQFTDVNTFIKEIEKLIGNHKE